MCSPSFSAALLLRIGGRGLRAARLTCASLALTCLAALATTAAAQPTSPHEAAATDAYDRGDLPTALREFQIAYAETQRADLLYVIGKLHAATGDCTRAIDHFQRFLVTRPGPKATDGARTEIARCERLLADQRGPGPVGPAGGGTTTAAPTETTGSASATAPTLAPPPPDDRPRRDKLPTVLIGSGVALDLLALLVYHQARDAQCDTVCTEITYDEYQAKEDRAANLRLTSIALASVGTVVLGVGTYRYLARRRARTVDVALVPTTSGAAFVVDGRF
jgi:hypothetical protein